MKILEGLFFDSVFADQVSLCGELFFVFSHDIIPHGFLIAVKIVGIAYHLKAGLFVFTQGIIKKLEEIEGVEGLAPVRQGLLRSTLPVTVSLTGDRVEITVRLILSSQVRLQSVAEQVQSEVKENVQNMTGIVVSKVHVIASDISFD